MTTDQKLLEKITLTINKAVKNTRVYEKAQYYLIGTFIVIGIVSIATIYNNKLLCNLDNSNKKNIQEISKKIDTKNETINSKIELLNSKIDSIHGKVDLLILSNKKIIYIVEHKMSFLNPFLTNSPILYLNESDKSDPPSERISETNMDEHADDYELINNFYDTLPCNNIKLTGVIKEE